MLVVVVGATSAKLIYVEENLPLPVSVCVCVCVCVCVKKDIKKGLTGSYYYLGNE